jgi:hypothetical protein
MEVLEEAKTIIAVQDNPQLPRQPSKMEKGETRDALSTGSRLRVKQTPIC